MGARHRPEASWKALVDAIRLELMRLTEQDNSIEKAVEDYCWACKLPRVACYRSGA